jgi:NADPH-dependent 2,4-dienoyl-CoA reductase/sulfur reductase-like enzyme
VISSGFLGCEVAASARSLGLEATLVDPLAGPVAVATGR